MFLGIILALRLLGKVFDLIIIWLAGFSFVFLQTSDHFPERLYEVAYQP
jgi:hypothetical protein